MHFDVAYIETVMEYLFILFTLFVQPGITENPVTFRIVCLLKLGVIIDLLI